MLLFLLFPLSVKYRDVFSLCNLIPLHPSMVFVFFLPYISALLSKQIASGTNEDIFLELEI